MTEPERNAPDTTDAERVREIEERAAKATPEPWRTETNGYRVAASGVRLGIFYGGNVREKNAEFAAHARSDIPWLISQLRSRDAELARLRALVVEAGEALDYCADNLEHASTYSTPADIAKKNARATAEKIGKEIGNGNV